MAGRYRPLLLLIAVLAAGVLASCHGPPSRSRVLSNKGPFALSSPSDLDLGFFVLLPSSPICKIGKCLLSYLSCLAWPSVSVRLAVAAAGAGAVDEAVVEVMAVAAQVLPVCSAWGGSTFMLCEQRVAACCLCPTLFSTPSRQVWNSWQASKAGTQTTKEKQASRASSFGHLKHSVCPAVGWQDPLLCILWRVLNIHGSCSRDFHLLFHSFLDWRISGKLGSDLLVLSAHLALSWR